MAKARIKLPDSAKVGDVIEVKTLISHVMETGQRKDAEGKTIPRSIINSFKATFAGTDVFTAELHPGMSANPYLSFFMKVPGPGRVRVHLDRRRRRQGRREDETQRRVGVRPSGSDTLREVARCPTSRCAPRRAPTR